MLTPEGFDYTPPKTAVRQRQLIEALQCGPVTTRDLNLLYNSMSATIKALEKRGVVVVEGRRAWRGCSEQTSLSSASGKAPVFLTNGQQQALAQIERARLDAHGDVVLVDGVTGSGKTEVYLSAIERVLAAGRSACVLVPEISLTAQTVGRFRSRFGETVAVFHSRLSAGAAPGPVDMLPAVRACGRGCPFGSLCPLSDLGSSSSTRNMRELTRVRQHRGTMPGRLQGPADMSRAAVVLGSATPSVESYYLAEQGEYKLLTLTKRAKENSRLAGVHIVDLREELAEGNRSIFSRRLKGLIEDRLANRQQVMLFMNRRGYAGFVSCRSCGKAMKCPHCDVSLTYHKNGRLKCHYCGFERPLPDRCPSCGSPFIAPFGTGTQKLEEFTKREFPKARILRMDADTTAKKGLMKKSSPPSQRAGRIFSLGPR